MDNNVLLEIKDLRVSFPLDEGMVRAVEGVDLTVRRGEVLGIVGESGCGKSITAHSVLRIIPQPGRIDSGQILFHGADPSGTNGNGAVDLTRLNPTGSEIRSIRGKDIAMVFQEPMSSFSPVHTIGSQIMEAILLHQDVSQAKAREMTIELLRLVGIPSAEERVDNYPHQFSGGMRQRAMIAMALSCNPALLIADEPTTALDVTIQAQILELMRGLQKRLGMAVMFITHNLGVIAQIADTVAIMYLGQVVEYGPVREILRNPKHPYTVDLLRAVPRLGKTAGQRLVAIEGSIPSPFERPSGCPFHPRCSRMMPGRCDVHMPAITPVGDQHTVRCLLYEPERSNA
ncbi:MAG TPA: ABC transporter ATP-binding protein [Anaerolineales bacterium]|nr:ABC transporter ATP-binding protein [Anaerolineales bacterium]